MSNPGAEKTERLVTLLEELLRELTGGESVEAGPASAQRHPEVARRDAEVLARFQELTARDHVIGLEATNSRLLSDLRQARGRNRALDAELEALRAELAAVYASRTWKAGRALARPLGKLRR